MEQTNASTLLRILAVVPALFASGCTDPGPFADISPHVEVVIDDQSVRAAASLFTGSDPYVLEPGEHLMLGVRDRTIEMMYDVSYLDYFGRPYYGVGAFSDLTAADEQVTLTLERGVDKGTIVAIAPVPFALDTPTAISFGTDLVIQWSPTSSDSMTWYVREHGGDASSDGAVPQDHGMVTVPHADVATVCQANCQLDAQVQRSRSTDIAGAFAAGRIDVRRVERAAITVTP